MKSIIIIILHVIKPNVSLINNDNALYRKFIFHGGAVLTQRNSKLVFEPNVMVAFQGPNREISFGNDFKYLLKQSSKYTGYYDESSISVGTYLRVGDAFYSTLFFNMAGFSLGLSYDLNLSNLSLATNGRGGMEMLLRYRISLGKTASSSF